MLWINLFFILSLNAAELPAFLTKHSSDTLRYVSYNGRITYLQKKPGLLALVSDFKSTDVLNEKFNNDFRINGSSAKKRLIIESIPNSQSDLSFLKNHEIFVVDYGNSQTRKIGQGKNPKLHLKDEWLSFFDQSKKIIHLQNLITEKKYEIKPTQQLNPFFIPDIQMVNPLSVVYSDVNDSGHSAIVSFNLITQNSTILYKSPHKGTKIEICRGEDYLGFGEFPYEGLFRNSHIQLSKTSETEELRGFTMLYESVNGDNGNMICLKDHIYFIKTTDQNSEINHRTTEAAKINLKDQKLEVLSNLKNVSQIIEMDGRVMIPFRGEFYVLEGHSDLREDKLKATPTQEEALLDI
jgi:hypothetical protein